MSLSETDRLVVLDLLERLSPSATPEAIRVFGTRLKGDTCADMDLCLLFSAIDDDLRSRIDQLAWEVGFDYGVTLCPLVLTSLEFATAPSETLIDRIRRDGVLV